VIAEQDWVQLETDPHSHGMTVRRVYPDAARDIFIGVRHPGGTRMLTIKVAAHAAAEAVRQFRDLPRTRGIELQFARLDGQNSELRVLLVNPTLGEVFNPLASDIADTAHSEPDDSNTVRSAIERFEHWRQMLQSITSSGLSTSYRRGLFGELSLLRDLILMGLPQGDAVRAWTGPTGAHQDFQFDQAAIEVKTSTGKEPQTLVINSERELDDTGIGCLILTHYSLDERQGGTGESLNSLVDRSRALVTNAAARQLLDSLLVRYGYMSDQRTFYDEPRYTLRRQRFWRVTGSFPRITEGDLRPGVGGCEYHIVVTGLDQHLLSDKDVRAVVMEGTLQ
jgi:Putative  PD-(D/E)XK family member, (DUF4420)